MENPELTQEQERLIEQIICEEISWEDSAVQAAVAAGGPFAEQIADLRKTMGALDSHLHANQSVFRGLEFNPNKIVATPEDCESTQALVEAVANPRSAWRKDGKGRQLVTRWVLPAAAVLLAWAFIQRDLPPTQTSGKTAPLSSEEPLGSDSANDQAHEFEANDFTEIQFETHDNPDGSYACEIYAVTESGELLLEERELGTTWRLTPEDKAKLVGHSRVKLIYTYEVDGFTTRKEAYLNRSDLD